MVQQLHQRRPQPQRLHVIGIIQRLDQLLKVVKGDHLVLEIDVGRVQRGHGGLHQVSVGGAAEEGGEDFGVEAAGGGFDDIVVVVGGVALVLDAPFEEAVQFGVHDGGVVVVGLGLSCGVGRNK